MAPINQPLLTIAIPTFNRANLLELSLSRILNASKGFEKYIEIVISNNCSVDNTESVIREAQKSFPIKYFLNSENIGFNYNYIKLIDEYVTGKYCWVIGDDDFIYPNAIKEIINVLINHHNLSFVNLKFDLELLRKLSFETKDYYLNNNSEWYPVTGRVLNFNELLSVGGAPGNLMFTFISSVIFKSDLIKNIDKSAIEKESFNSFYNCFPHSFFYAKTMKGMTAYVFDTPLITAIVHDKLWDNRMWLLYLKFIPELHNHYLNNGFRKEDLQNQKNLVIRAGIPYLFLNLFSNQESFQIKVSFLRRYGSEFNFYFLLLNLIIKKILKSLGK